MQGAAVQDKRGWADEGKRWRREMWGSTMGTTMGQKHPQAAVQRCVGEACPGKPHGNPGCRSHR